MDQPEAVFFYDLGDPECYLAAERITAALPVLAEWEPVLAAAVLDDGLPRRDLDVLAERAAEQGLLALHRPVGWPPDTRAAMLAATYAKRGGRAVAFSLAAFRQAFAGGRDLADENTVLIAAAACELHPAAVLKAISMDSVAAQLEAAGARARAAGVVALPAIAAGGSIVCGADSVERAAALLGGAAGAKL